MLKVRTLFSGIGSPESALKNLEIPYELVDFCEVDKYAVKSYCAVHGVSEDKNLGDITKVWGRNLPYADLLVWGFPCQDISVAGKQRGLKEGETRSGLYYEGFRILKETKPKYSVIENVKNLVGKKFKADFESMLEDIESLGYNNYWKVLNAKDYGIPQNRERVFIVSIRKDIDAGTFSFPKGFDNGLRLKDFLESEVDEKYYVSQEKTDKLIENLKDKRVMDKLPKGDELKIIGTTQNSDAMGTNFRSWVYDIEGKVGTLSATMYKEPTQICVPCLTPDRVEKRQNGRRFKEDGEPMFTLTSQDRHGILQIGELDIKGNEQIRRVYSPDGCSPTLNTMAGGNRQPKIIMYDVPQTVTVRKYPVDVENLKKILKEHKQISKLTNKDIAETLDKPVTLVEHWFRQDKCFSIPDTDIWFRLKELLNITTDEFDKSITEFVEQDGVFEKSNRVYDAEGIAPTLTVASADEKILEEPKIIEDFYANRDIRVYDDCPTLRSERNGLKVAIKEATKKGYAEATVGDSINIQFPNLGVAQTLETSCNQATLTSDYRIRKLTPRECWRLMGFKDEEFERAAQVNSNSQLYKQAGNSIVTNCLFYIFKSLLQAEINAIYEENKTLS